MFYILVFMLSGLQAATAQTRTLDDYVQQALANSPLLKDYRQQQQINLLDSMRIVASYGPQVNASSTNSYAPVIRGYGYDNAITNGANVNAIVGVNKTFVSRKNLNIQFAAIRLQNQGLDNTAQISAQDLQRTVTAQYITAYGDLEQLRFTREITELLKKEEVVLKQLTGGNVYRQTDYLTFLVTLQQQQLSLKQLDIQFRNDYATLNYLCGIIDTTQTTLTQPLIVIATLPDQNNSIFFRQYQLDSLSLTNSQSLVDFSYKPKISAFVDGGYNSSLAYQPYKNFGTSVGVTVSVPLYDGHQRRIQHRKLDVSEKTRQGYKEFFTKQYSQQVAQLMQQLQGTQSLIDQINDQIKYSQGLIDINMKLLETGDAKIPDLVIALNNYLSARNLLTQNTVSRLQIMNQINYWNR